MDSNELPPLGTPPPVPPTPPPLVPPPVIEAPPAGPRPKSGRGWMVLALVLIGLLGISVLFNFGQLASAFIPVGTTRAELSGPRLDETLLEDHSASSKIAVIDVDGIISSRGESQGGYSMVELIKAQLDRAAEDRKVKAVLLRMDSPGGEVLASDEIYRALTDFQDDSHGKPVITSMGDLAASGGYYIASASRWIVANELTITGSIGVIMHGWNYRGLMDKVGLKPMVYKSGEFKDMLSGEREPDSVSQKEHAMVQALIDETYARFQKVVAEGRSRAHTLNQTEGRALTNNWMDFADGRVFSGTTAFDLGFVDELGTFEDAVKRARKLAGIPSANLIQYRPRHDLSDLFRLFGKSEAPVIKVDVGLEAPRIESGRLYFLSPTLLR